MLIHSQNKGTKGNLKKIHIVISIRVILAVLKRNVLKFVCEC